MTQPVFVHLRVHSEYSLIDSVVRVRPLVKRAQALGMPALALTDVGNVSALVKFYRASIAAGIKPLVGADVLVDAGIADRGPARTRMTLLCMSHNGYRQLCRLLSRSHAGGDDHSQSVIRREWLDEPAVSELIALSGGQPGAIGQALVNERTAEATELASWLAGVFPGRFYLELCRLGVPGEERYLASAVGLAAQLELPVVATNDVRFITAGEFDAHETRVCIATSRTLDDASRPKHYTAAQYLKSPEEMAALFQDLPEALANSVEIARRCNFDLPLNEIHMPQFEVDGDATAETVLRERSASGLDERLSRLPEPPAGEQREIYNERLETELGVICRMGFEGYFLIVADFITWARNNGVPVGPGRGSGAGSLVAWVLGITDLDPIEHDLLFERFLNPERVSMPDFDIDFCIEGRDRVIDYVSQRYGRDRVSQIITYGTMAAKAVVRDVGRVLGLSYGYVDGIAKLIPFEIGITLEKALEDDEELKRRYQSEEDVTYLIDLARQLEGLARNAGTHAGGVVIAPSELTEFMPLYSDPDSATLTQLDKDDLESVGLVKFDFLGLKTLTIIDKAVRTINAARAENDLEPVDVNALPFDDPKTFALLKACDTTAVFQLESRGMKDLVKRLQPDCFDDIVAILALFRPGPLQSGMVDDFIDRKHGRNAGPIDYLHPRLEPILKPTYGVILYQEQVMQVAQELAGYSLGGADLLRRAMGKKKPEEMVKQREIFLAGAKEQEVDEKQAAYIFDLMEKFAGYGFNKSHSAAYALLAYQTAWLKAHYPEAFMASVMTADMDVTDKLVVLKDDCAHQNISIDPPSLNASFYGFTVGGPGRILYGLGAIKGVGRSAVESLIAEREKGGPYQDLFDLCRRIDSHRVNKRALEALTRSGALDDLGLNRATLLNAIPDALRLAENAAAAEAAGQGALFGDVVEPAELEHVIEAVPDWNQRERLDAEYDSLGLFLTGHPFDEYKRHWETFGGGSLAARVGSLPEPKDRWSARHEMKLAGVVMDMRRRGNRLSVILDDNTDRIEVTVFEEVYDQSRHLLQKHQVLVIEGQLRWDDFLGAWRQTASKIRTIEEAMQEKASGITIRLSDRGNPAELVTELQGLLRDHRNGSCEVSFRYKSAAGEARLVCGDTWMVRPTRELRDNLDRLLGPGSYTLHYPRHLS